MEMRRLASRKWPLGQHFGSLTAWYGLLSGYGERWGHALAWFGATLAISAFFFWVYGILVRIPAVGANNVATFGLVYVGSGSPPKDIDKVSAPFEIL